MKAASAFLLLGALAAVLHGQTQPEFEVASIRLASSDVIRETRTPTLDVPPGTVLRFNNLRTRDLIMLAYNVGGRQLSGPEWLLGDPLDPTAVERFDVMAKIPDNATKEQIPLMLQNLLAERFKLKLHNEPRSIQAFALEIGKAGHKLKEAPEGDNREPGCARSMYGPEGTTATCQNMTTAQFAQQLQSLAPAYFRDGPVIDKTGLAKTYDYQLTWKTLQELNAGDTGPTMFEAVEKLGLTLNKRRETVDIFVIDRCEKLPTEN